MGSCLNGDENQHNSNRNLLKHFQEDLELEDRSQIYQPLTTTLFNTLRKSNDVVVIEPENINQQPTLFHTVNLQFDTITPGQLKTILNFKKIVFIGSFEKYQSNIIKKIRSHVTISKMYILEPNSCAAFLKEFSIFSVVQAELKTNQIPILVFDSRELIETKHPNKRIFIHASTKQDRNIYKKLHIEEAGVIKEPTDNLPEDKLIQYYVNQLERCTKNSMVMLHNSALHQNIMLEILATFVNKSYSIPAIPAKGYLRRYLPNATIPSESLIDANNNNQIIANDLNLGVDSSTKYQDLFVKLADQSNPEKTQRAYNLLSKLTSNIYANPKNQDMYRHVKSANKQMEELLTKFTSGKKLLEMLGFTEKGDNWINLVESKYLKIYKTDFDLGFKKYKAKANN